MNLRSWSPTTAKMAEEMIVTMLSSARRNTRIGATSSAQLISSITAAMTSFASSSSARESSRAAPGHPPARLRLMRTLGLFRRAAFYSGLKSKVGLIAAKTASLRVNMNTDGCLLASHVASRYPSTWHAPTLLISSLSHNVRPPCMH